MKTLKTMVVLREFKNKEKPSPSKHMGLLISSVNGHPLISLHEYNNPETGFVVVFSKNQARELIENLTELIDETKVLQ